MMLVTWFRCTIAMQYHHMDEAMKRCQYVLILVILPATYSNHNCRVSRDLGRDRDVHLEVCWVAAKASDLLERSKGRAGRSQNGGCSRECLHVSALYYEPLIRLGDLDVGVAILLVAYPKGSYITQSSILNMR
jgi:hypothetical protein